MIRLSFDDGPGPSTPDLLDVMGAADCTATFFVLGKHLAEDPTALLRTIREGHVVGNHTWSHARPGALSAQALEDEIATTDALIHEAYRCAGVSPPERIPLRLPYGARPADPRLAVLRGLGREHTGWTALFDDWQRPAPAPALLVREMIEHIRHQLKRGEQALLCLHEGSRHRESRPATVAAVAGLLALPEFQALLRGDVAATR